MASSMIQMTLVPISSLLWFIRASLTITITLCIHISRQIIKFLTLGCWFIFYFCFYWLGGTLCGLSSITSETKGFYFGAVFTIADYKLYLNTATSFIFQGRWILFLEVYSTDGYKLHWWGCPFDKGQTILSWKRLKVFISLRPLLLKYSGNWALMRIYPKDSQT